MCDVVGIAIVVYLFGIKAYIIVVQPVVEVYLLLYTSGKHLLPESSPVHIKELYSAEELTARSHGDAAL